MQTMVGQDTQTELDTLCDLQPIIIIIIIIIIFRLVKHHTQSYRGAELNEVPGAVALCGLISLLKTPIAPQL